MAGTRAVAVKKAVIDGMAATLPAIVNVGTEHVVEFDYGYTFGGTHSTERVFAGRSRADTPPAALKSGRNFRDEAGTFDLTVLVEYVGGSPEDAETRAVVIGTAIEEWIADRKSNELGVTGLQSLLIIGWEMTPLGNDRGHMAELVYKVRWTARLT